MASDNWFESWFDSPLYEKLYAKRDDTEAALLVDRISRRLPPAQYPFVLDMGCGRGRHSVLLAQHGYRVTGVDLSETAIAKSRSIAMEEGISNISFETGDMRYWRGGPFDLVCNLFTSFGYFENDEDNRQVVQNLSSNLKPGGFLVLDYLNPEYVRHNLIPAEEIHIGDMQCQMTRSIEDDTIVKSISFESPDSGKQLNYQERVKLYNIGWFEHFFREHGLQLLEKQGDYNGKPFNPLNSSRMLLLAQKKPRKTFPGL